MASKSKSLLLVVSKWCFFISPWKKTTTTTYVTCVFIEKYGKSEKATPRENLFMPYANNKGADQPAHPRSLISAFVVRCLDRRIPLFSKSKISRLYLVPVAEQASLSLTWAQTPKTDFLVTWLNYHQLPILSVSLLLSFERLTFGARRDVRGDRRHLSDSTLFSLSVSPRIWSLAIRTCFWLSCN